MTARTWTNVTLRKELGEHGFFELPESILEVVPDGPSQSKSWRTEWTRRGAIVYLITSESESPRIEDTEGNVLDIDAISYRDPNARQPDKGKGL